MSIRLSRRKCPICSSNNKELLHKQIFKEYFTHEIVSCIDCGFVYVGNSPSESFYKRYYREESKYEGIRQHEDHEITTKKEIDKFLTKNLKKKAQILDIGCSTGSILAHVRTRGFHNVYGIDPAPKCGIVAKKQYNIEVGTFDINSFNPAKKYDFIILSQVLEHLTDIRGSIKKIISWLNEGGYIFIGVPNSANFYLNFEEPFGEFSTEHINFFTEYSLSSLMNNFTKVVVTQKDNVLLSIWQKSAIDKNSILKYIKYSNVKQLKIKKIIEKLPNKTIVWGVGALTRRLLSSTNLGKKTLFFIDSNPNLIGKTINRLDIHSPDILREYNTPIFISSFKFRDEIKKYIKDKNYSNRILNM